MGIEALWTIEFGMDSGVAVLESGRVFGGDAQYYYLGTYKVHEEAVEADLTITHFKGEARSTFGTADTSFGVTLKGQYNGNKITGYIARKEAPGQHVPVILTRREDLP